MAKPDPYQIEDDARTLQRAGEVMGDKVRHKQAVAHLQKQVASVQKIIGTSRSAPAKSAPVKRSAPAKGKR